MLIAGLRATTECDFKKIIALSTLSQLGIIIACVALKLTDLALFHLVTHALFKALLFVCAGRIIHLHNHNQDLRLIGNLTHQVPVTMACITIANLSLCGAPFLAGFYSKDLILETILFHPYNIISVALFFIATGCTAAYSVRFIVSSSWSPSNFPPLHQLSNTDSRLTTPIVFLTTGAIFRGATLN
jgi:NADH-ubiquinone oxidoreductase chain 5